MGFLGKWKKTDPAQSAPGPGDGNSLSFHQADHEADHGHDGKDEKEDLGNLDGTGGNATETEHGCNQSDHEENNGIVQHVDLLAGARPMMYVALANETPVARLNVEAPSIHR
jgi:hypothetical protein